MKWVEPKYTTPETLRKVIAEYYGLEARLEKGSSPDRAIAYLMSPTNKRLLQFGIYQSLEGLWYVAYWDINTKDNQ